jgi:hypothetical protein
MLPDSLGEEHPLGNHVSSQRCSLRRESDVLRMHNLTQWFVKKV